MTVPARPIDVIDTAPAFTAAQVAAFDARFAGHDAAAMLAELLGGDLKGRVAVVSSFGAESAVLLDLVAAVDRSVPVIFVNTQKMFGETLAYRDALSEQLGFTDLRVFRPDPYEIAAQDSKSLRWAYDPDGCCDLRKVAPLRRCAAHWRRSMPGYRAARASRPAAPACRASSLMRAA